MLTLSISPTDFVADYTKDAEAFAEKCAACTSPEEVSAQIDDFAANMAAAGYTDSSEEPFASARAYGTKVIADSLKLCLANEDGILEGKKAGESMKLNYGVLNYRKGLIPELAVRPSPLGDIQVLVVHGTDDAAVSLCQLRTSPSLGADLLASVPLRAQIPRAHSFRCRG